MIVIYMLIYLAIALIIAIFLFSYRLRDKVKYFFIKIYEHIKKTASQQHGFLSAEYKPKKSVTLGWWQQHFKWVTVLFAGLSLPVVFSLLLIWQTEDRIDDTFVQNVVIDNDTKLIHQLLEGEQLAPPPAPPEEVFATLQAELIQQASTLPKPNFDFGSGTGDDVLEHVSLTSADSIIGADRKWGLMNKDYKQRVLTVFKLMKEKYGYDMVLLEGYRSPERQNRLASQGKHVTNATGYKSYHQFGLAADCAFLKNGKIVISEKDPWAMKGYQLYGQLAESVGLTWGGRWKMMDLGHTELRMKGVLGNAEIAKRMMEENRNGG